MPRISIDEKSREVREGRNLLEICLEQGIDLPYFCWHPALGSVGACRQCAVKQFKNAEDTQGRLVMACMTPAAEGTRISVAHPEARAFRKMVAEWLMLNHPHDCPICDEGGECHLQDMTVMTGHTYRRTRFRKRTFRNQDLGSFVNHEMNRCIACYRCVRFYREYAGGRDLDVFAAHDHVYFGRQEDGTLESEFSGNLVEVCPTGVFTDKTLKKHYTRKWDLQTAPGICAQCGVGCNTIPGERYGSLRRMRNRYHDEINGYFLCDRGRYGYEFVNGEQRIRKAWRRGGRCDGDGPDDKAAIREFQELLKDPAALSRTIGIGSPRASVESDFALKELVGERNFFSGLSDSEAASVSLVAEVLEKGPTRIASLKDIEASDAVFVLGEDLANTAPRIALSVRQAIRNVPLKKTRSLKIADWLDGPVRETIQEEKSPVFIAAPTATRLDDIAAATYFAAPDDLARLGFAVANLIDPRAPAVPGLPESVRSLARKIAEALCSASNPAILSGTGCASRAVIQAAANIASTLVNIGKQPAISLIVAECNTLGAGLLGGGGLSEAFERAGRGEIETAIVMENDLFRRAPAAEVRQFLKSVRRVIVMDTVATAMIPHASLILPAASFAESSGTYVSQEGRAQRFFRVFPPAPEIRESWRWLRGGGDLDDVLHSISKCPNGFMDEALRRVIDAAPPADYREKGQRIPRQPHRFSGRTSMHARESVFEPQPPEDRDSALSFSMEGSELQAPAALTPRFWAPGWNSIQALNRFQSEVGGPLRGGPAGVRLIDPKDAAVGYFRDVPEAFEPSSGRFLAVPLHHVFGSDETSALSPSLAERIPRPYVAVSLADATRLKAETGLSEGEEIFLSLFPEARGILLAVDRSLPVGVIGVPRGLPRMPYGVCELPAWCELRKREIRGAA